MTEPDIPASDRRAMVLFEALPRLVDGDPDLQRRGRFLDCEFTIGVGKTPLHVTVRSGKVVSVARGPFLLRPATFALEADGAAWLEFLAPMPRPGAHDIFALSKAGRLKISGNLVPLMGNLQYVKDVLAAPRAIVGAEIGA